ncbi:response regulator [Nocardiopsis flavescens]|uniref:DNA-binding response regulator, NarL/FixJ family, contains REC and HTH domains n=1 Tax=Nocardiopsis flavescens TaxID=758803 RepID=A0A1M6VQH1_9ACTN|nr:response regulator transcription factor [Nocardiopsis flavescens]SHK83585.1 DNA-binding response regulator, NarL/FixJ family, contains REC and HTH domains [Nocardiopsis flavescens]
MAAVNGGGGEVSVRVLIVDDEALMRAGLRLMVDGTAGIAVVGEAGDGAAAVAQVAALDPDVVLMDVRMPGTDGLEAIRMLRAAGARARVIVLTAFDTDGHLLEALRGGAVSFLLKESPPETVVAAVHDAARGRPMFSPGVLARLVSLAVDAGGTAGAAAGGDPSRPPAHVTSREWEVGRLVAEGGTNADIAAALDLSVTTVKTHLGNLYAKLHVTNRVQLAIRVLEHTARGPGDGVPR